MNKFRLCFSFMTAVAVSTAYAVARSGIDAVGSSPKPNSTPAPTPSPRPTPAVDAGMFSSIFQSLKARSGVPIYLPSPYAPDPSEQLYPHVLEASARGYAVSIDTLSTCNGQPACSIGEIDGESGHVTLMGTKVRLANGTVAYFTPPQVGAGCTDSALRFYIGANTYNVGITCGRVEDAIPTANVMKRF